MGSIALDLLVGGDCAENDLGEALTRKHPETDSADGPTLLHQGQRLVLRVKDEPEIQSLS